MAAALLVLASCRQEESSRAGSCRNDYICARIGEEEDGACVPAYFLFQLRVDGHPTPN